MSDKNKFSMVPIKRTDVFQTVIERLSNLLDSGQFKPGDRLPSERELSETLGVSRTSVRQGLKVLEAAGRIETRVGSGTYVIEVEHASKSGAFHPQAGAVDANFMRQLIVARTGIERTIFEDYSHRVTKSGIRQLRELLEENERLFLDEDSADENSGLDLSFESKVAELTQNEILIEMQRQIHQLWISAWRQYGFVPEDKQVLHEEHIALLDALASKNTARTIDLIVQHVDKDIE